MARIRCRQPSTGKPLTISLPLVGAAWATLVEAPDFSILDPGGNLYPVRDPDLEQYGLAAGEVFLLRPLLARNLTETTRWIEARVLFENGAANTALSRIYVPAGDTVTLITQGLSLMKVGFDSANGDRLQVRSQVADGFAVIGSAEERLYADHIGVVTS